jgi:DNA repair protein RadC
MSNTTNRRPPGPWATGSCPPDSSGQLPDEPVCDPGELELLVPILGRKAARQALNSFSLRSLLYADRERLLTLPHIGPIRADAILALPSLLEKLASTSFTGSSISCSHDVFRRFRYAMGLRDRENFLVLTLSSRNVVLSEEVVAVGSVNSVHVAPAHILKQAIMRNAPSILCLHNHPSGDPTPSAEDRSLTERIARAASLMGIRLLDHLVITAGSYYSFSDSGEL